MLEAESTTLWSDAMPGSAMREAYCDSDANFHILFDAHPQAMWIYDPATLAIVDVNEAAVQNYGYSREEFLSLTVEHLHPRDEFAALRDKMESGAGPIVCRYVKKDGTSIGASIIPHPLNSGGQRWILIRTTAVTADKRSEMLYHTLVDSLPVSVLGIDASMNVTMVNQRFLEKSRRLRFDTLGKALSKVFPAVILDELDLLKKIRQAFQTGKGGPAERLMYRAPGLPLRVYYYTLVPIACGSRVEHVLLVLDDVTEQVRLGEEIRRVEHHLAGVVENANEIVLSTDLSGRIASWNHAAEHITGYGLADVQGGDLFRLLAERSRLSFAWLFGDIERHGSAHTTDCEIVTREGTLIPVSWVLSPLKNGSGQLVGIVAVGRDLTEQRKFEQQLRQSEKLAALGVIAAGIAHEVRTPLAIASSSAQFLMEESISDEFRRECATKVHHGIERASDIVGNLLRFARPMSTDIIATDLPDVIREVVPLISNQALAQQVAIELCLGSGPLRVMGSASLLQQVFLNLCLNALRAMPQGGTLTMSGELGREEVVIRVSDTGCGIAPADIGRIFDPFYTTAPVGQGTGLGLAICYLIVKQHGGSIGVESTLGHGTTFTLRLPAA